jgi:ATP-dependent Clp protease ATP-binding subunit ClpA
VRHRRLSKVEREIAELRETAAGMKAHWQQEKEAIQQIRQTKEQIEQARFQIEAVTRKGDLGRASELQYGTLPQLEKQIQDENKKLAELQSKQKMLKEEVDAEDVAEVVARWTGIPVSRLLEGEMQKLLHVGYMEKHTVARLAGAPPGYVGYDEGGQLTEAVRRRPYAVVLFDEIEKAHPDVFNALLQVLDDGRLTDGKGRTVDFRNTVVIMTSNVGSDLIQESSRRGEDAERLKDELIDVLRRTFRPEFLKPRSPRRADARARSGPGQRPGRS